MGFIDAMRGEGFAVETICAVLREQGVAVAARTYRAWKAPGRVLAAHTVTDAGRGGHDAGSAYRRAGEGDLRESVWAAQDDRPAAPGWSCGRALHRRPADARPGHELGSSRAGSPHHYPGQGRGEGR